MLALDECLLSVNLASIPPRQCNSYSISPFFSSPTQCALSQPQSHRNTYTRVFHASFKPIQVLLLSSSHQSTCLPHAVLFTQVLRQCHPASLSSTSTHPSHRVHALRAVPAFPACPVARNTRASLVFLLPSCFYLVLVCVHAPRSPHAPLHNAI